MKSKIDFLVEWAVWGHLDSKTDLELILLKGHLLLENIIDTVLERKNIKNYNNYSFHKKILTLEKIDFNDTLKKDFILSSLKGINKLRNQLAHEFHFDIKNGKLELWAFDILEKLKGTKYTNYTFRTKIVHSFSIISITLLELTE